MMEHKRRQRGKIAKVIILREAHLRWLLEICKYGIKYQQLKLVLDHARWEEGVLLVQTTRLELLLNLIIWQLAWLNNYSKNHSCCYINFQCVNIAQLIMLTDFMAHASDNCTPAIHQKFYKSIQPIFNWPQHQYRLAPLGKIITVLSANCCEDWKLGLWWPIMKTSSCCVSNLRQTQAYCF